MRHRSDDGNPRHHGHHDAFNGSNNCNHVVTTTNVLHALYSLLTLTRISDKFVHDAISSLAVISGYLLRWNVASRSCSCWLVKWVLWRLWRPPHPLPPAAAPGVPALTGPPAADGGAAEDGDLVLSVRRLLWSVEPLSPLWSPGWDAPGYNIDLLLAVI